MYLKLWFSQFNSIWFYLYFICDIGAGTFGTVRRGLYRPKNGEPEVECALKYLKPTEELPNQKSEILREADAMAMLDHPNIVRLYGENLCPFMYISCKLNPQSKGSNSSWYN